MRRVVFMLRQRLVVIRHIPVTFPLVATLFGGVAFMRNAPKRVAMGQPRSPLAMRIPVAVRLPPRQRQASGLTSVTARRSRWGAKRF